MRAPIPPHPIFVKIEISDSHKGWSWPLYSERCASNQFPQLTVVRWRAIGVVSYRVLYDICVGQGARGREGGGADRKRGRNNSKTARKKSLVPDRVIPLIKNSWQENGNVWSKDKSLEKNTRKWGSSQRKGRIIAVLFYPWTARLGHQLNRHQFHLYKVRVFHRGYPRGARVEVLIIFRAGPAVKRTFFVNTTTSQVHRISASWAYRCELQTNLVTCSIAAARLAQF